MKSEHGDWQMRTLGNGADADTNFELQGNQDTGKYVDMRNGRIQGMGKDNDVAKKIGGETLLYPNNLPSNTYDCMIKVKQGNNDIEVWADRLAVNDSLIRINGTIVLQSPLFAVTVADPPQASITDRDSGPKIGITALSFVPLIFDIQDLINSSSTTKYFADFDPANYEVNLYVSLDTVAFIELVPVGGGGGLPVGLYSYEMRYVSDAGDRTHFSAPSPMIPVIEVASNASPQFPYSKTRGNAADPNSNTGYGIHLRFRVNNFHNYDYIEIKRTAWNQGEGIGFAPEPVIIAKIAISNEEVSYRDFIDPADQNVIPGTPISTANDTESLAVVTGAKTCQFYDRRFNLMNVKLESKAADFNFTQIDGSSIHPVIHGMGKAGHADPYNFAYYRAYMGGEKQSFAVTPFDGTWGPGFAAKIPDGQDYQYPNRRDAVSATTALYSYEGTVKAADTANSPTQTHEVFDLVDAVAKDDLTSFKNIFQRGAGLISQGFKSVTTVNEDLITTESDGEIANHGAHIGGAGTDVYPYWHPYTPTGDQDSDTTGHNYIVNTRVSVDNTEPSGHNTDGAYRPPGFGANYYSHGALLGGVTNIPDWVKGFSIVRTDVATRVVAQGLFSYHMIPAQFDVVGNTALAGKYQDRGFFFSPDIENGIVSPDLVNDMIANPQNYSLQFVSPLGFFSEVYNFNNQDFGQRDYLIDMISYARMIRDVDGGALNPFEDANMGYSGGDGYRYVGYGKWRNTGQQPGLFNGPDGGDTTFAIKGVERITEGRGTFLGISSQTDMYGRAYTGGTSEHNFEDQGMKDWTEPVYIVNIVRTGANVNDQNIQPYKHIQFQKMEATIGKGTGLANQSYILIDERWEDCIPALSSTWPTASTDRFIYIKHPNGQVEKWMNVTFYTPVQRLAIANYIQTNGAYTNGATGTYTHTNDNNRFFTIVFDQSPFYPQALDLILVRYDDTAPIRFWGGDTTVGETIFAPIDREADAYDNAADTQFALGVGFPYRHWKINPRNYIVKRTTGANRIQDQSWLYLGYLRQLCMMFTVESRAAMPYSYSLQYPLQSFPAMNYVMRPCRWKSDQGIADQNIYQQYVDTYGETEKDQWKWGGFRFLQQVNPQYTSELPVAYFSKPEYGFIEQTHFPTRVMWSLPSAINVQDTPGNRSFPANNAFDFDDQAGEIKMAYREMGDKGENMYAFTETGIVMALTKKALLYNVSGNLVSQTGIDSFIGGEFWLMRDTGMDDQWWRSAAPAVYPAAFNDKGEGILYKQGLFFANSDTVYLFTDNDVVDIGRANYFSRLRPYLDSVLPGVGSKVTGFWDSGNNEYWLHIHTPGELPMIRTFMYSPHPAVKAWIGYNDHVFDQAAMGSTGPQASASGITNMLDTQNYVISGSPIAFEVIVPFGPSASLQKEFIKVRANSDRSMKPTRIEFLDLNESLLCALDNSIQGQYYLLWYDGWEQQIPRKDQLPRDRVQYRTILVKCVHDLPVAFVLATFGTESKILK